MMSLGAFNLTSPRGTLQGVGNPTLTSRGTETNSNNLTLSDKNNKQENREHKQNVPNVPQNLGTYASEKMKSGTFLFFQTSLVYNEEGSVPRTDRSKKGNILLISTLKE